MNNLKALRKSLGLTQDQMGREIGLGGKYVKQQYNKIERGVRPLTKPQQIIVGMLAKQRGEDNE